MLCICLYRVFDEYDTSDKVVELIDLGNKNVFTVKNMQEDSNKDIYIECFYFFVNAFYREVDVAHLIQYKTISEILRPTDEAFLLLCIMVYFKEYTNCKQDVGERELSNMCLG